MLPYQLHVASVSPTSTQAKYPTDSTMLTSPPHHSQEQKWKRCSPGFSVFLSPCRSLFYLRFISLFCNFHLSIQRPCYIVADHILLPATTYAFLQHIVAGCHILSLAKLVIRQNFTTIPTTCYRNSYMSLQRVRHPHKLNTPQTVSVANKV